MSLEERKDFVIEHICCGDWCFGRVKFSESHFAIGINERLLIDSSNALKVTNIKRVLRP